MFNKIIKITSFLGLVLLPLKTFAVCPVCAVAVGAGIGLSRYLGIDDVVTGLWIGGLTVAMVMWTLDYLARKGWRFKFDILTVTVGYYLLIVVPLYFMDLIGHPLNVFWGIDKIVLGTLIGSLALWGASMWYESLKKNNAGHAYFPFQKVAMPVLSLAILSAIFYFLTK